jgi:hypothetical protein
MHALSSFCRKLGYAQTLLIRHTLEHPEELTDLVWVTHGDGFPLNTKICPREKKKPVSRGHKYKRHYASPVAPRTEHHDDYLSLMPG